MSIINPENNRTLTLTVQNASDAAVLPDAHHWRLWLSVSQQQDLEVTLRVVGLTEGQQLNADFRGKDYATNVLTFVYDEIPLIDDTKPLYGDIVICAPVIEREAAEQGKSLMAHYAHMTIHAALHLQGFDHQTTEEAEQMEALERQLMLQLDFPDPYID